MAQRSLGSVFINGLFSLDGRIGRGAFWMCSIALVIAAVLFSVALTSGLRDITNNAWPIWVLPVVFQLLIAWPIFAITVKRGHDRGRSAFWTLGVNIAGQIVPWALWANERYEGAFWVWAVIGVYALFEYGLLAGEAGENRYGPLPA